MKARLQARLILLVTLALISLAAATGCSNVPGNADAAKTDNDTMADASKGAQLPFGHRSGKPSSVSQITVPAGTSVAIRLQSSISSATAQPGQHFDAVLDQPLVVNGRTVADRGTPVVGRMVQAKKSGRLHSSGYLRLTLASIGVNGSQVPVQASSIFVQGANHNKRNVAMIGGGAGAGALIGALAGGGKGALIGSAVGAGAGTTGAYATGKKDVGFGAERRLTFRLTQSITVS